MVVSSQMTGTTTAWRKRFGFPCTREYRIAARNGGARIRGLLLLGCCASSWACNQSPARPTLVVTSPSLTLPGLGGLKELRPTLVANAKTFGPVGSVLYRFEIATDEGFRPVLI